MAKKHVVEIFELSDEDAFAFLKDVMVTAQALKEVKPLIKKGRKPNPNAKPKPEWTKHHASPESLAKIEAAIRKVIADVYDEYVEGIMTRLGEWVYNYFEERESESQDPYNYLSAKAKRWGQGPDPVVLSVLTKLTKKDGDRYDRNAPISEVDDYEERLEALAKADAEHATAFFIQKNKDKLNSIVAQKGDVTDVQASASYGRGILLGHIVVSFQDGTGFTAITEIRWNRSSRGLEFNQFPTRFVQVRLPDGSIKNAASEKWMNEDFIQAGR